MDLTMLELVSTVEQTIVGHIVFVWELCFSAHQNWDLKATAAVVDFAAAVEMLPRLVRSYLVDIVDSPVTIGCSRDSGSLDRTGPTVQD